MFEANEIGPRHEKRREIPPPGRIMGSPESAPGFWCIMNVSGPVGMPCYCRNPFGFPPTVNGVTVPQ